MEVENKDCTFKGGSGSSVTCSLAGGVEGFLFAFLLYAHQQSLMIE